METFATVKTLSALAFLPLLLLAPSTAIAQEGPALCASMANDTERLTCYDGLFRPVDPVAGTMAVVFSSEQDISAYPSGRAPATMTVNCAAGKLSVAFAFAGHTLSATGKDSGITLQPDVQPARTTTLPVSPDNLSMLINGNGAVGAFLDTLQGATNLSVRTTPFSYRSLSVRFRVDGAAAQVAPIRSACE
ncbi:hypothetical protein [Devosia sp.]|uniref:hypothetical protein n=1 Tax=Devosia sp. TaxID=1871048 RepID=UPI0032653607